MRVSEVHMDRLKKSHEIYHRAKEIILGGTQTISKQVECYDADFFPAYIERGAGSRLWDIDGNEYIDFIAALGPIILGYCHPAVDLAVHNQLAKGVIFSSNCRLEVDLAEKLTSIIPNAEKVRFFKTGAEATSAAVRLARNFTQRDKVISCGYHGWHDWYVAQNNEGGIPKVLSDYIVRIPFGNFDAASEVLDNVGHEVACVIVEPVAFESNGEFLEVLASMARKAGALIVFDEIITGFRLGLRGAQHFFSIDADLAVFGKAMANGLPLSAVTGRNDIFEAGKDLWISTTFGGEALSLAASLATISELDKEDHFLITKKLGQALFDGWKEQLERCPNVRAKVHLVDSMPSMLFDSGAKHQEDVFIREMLKQGFLVRRRHYWFISSKHTEQDIQEALSACERAFHAIESAAFLSVEIRDKLDELQD